mgnify:CR=1 FL=1
MLNIFYNVLPIFLIALIGSLIRKKWLKSDEFWRGLEKLSYYVLYPSVLFEHILKTDIQATEIFKLVLALTISTVIVAVILIFLQSKLKIDRKLFTSVFQGGTRYNNYILFALGSALFGDDGLSIVSYISPYMIIFTNIISVMIFVCYIPKEGCNTVNSSIILMIRSIVTNPFILASMIGFTINLYNFELNIGVEKTIQHFADTALTIGIIIVGASLKFSVRSEYIKLILFTSAIKLLLMPLTTFIVLWLMKISGVNKSVGILFSCLPCASSSYILSRQLGGAPDLYHIQ